MKNVHNASSDVLVELDIEEHYRVSVEDENAGMYRVTFQSKQDQNNYCIIRVHFLFNDDVVVTVHERSGMNHHFAHVLKEELAIAIDPDHYESD